MPKALSIDLRERVIATIEAGASCRQAAERLGVGAATAIGLQTRFRQKGGSPPGRWAETGARTASRHTRL